MVHGNLGVPAWSEEPVKKLHSIQSRRWRGPGPRLQQWHCYGNWTGSSYVWLDTACWAMEELNNHSFICSDIFSPTVHEETVLYKYLCSSRVIVPAGSFILLSRLGYHHIHGNLWCLPFRENETRMIFSLCYNITVILVPRVFTPTNIWYLPAAKWTQKWIGSKDASLSYTCLLAQSVKNLPAVWETWVWPLGRKDPLEKGMATHSSILAWRILWTEATILGVAKSQTWLNDEQFACLKLGCM